MSLINDMKLLLSIFIILQTLFAQGDPIAIELAEQERAFSNASEKYGIRESFLQFLADDCVMFDPYPINGKVSFQNRPASKALLQWFPTFVEVAASGDFGISTGPWEYRRTKEDTSVSYGHFFSVWKKQNYGQWKVILDIGPNYPKEKKREEGLHFKQISSQSKQSKTYRDKDSVRIELLEAEHAFIESIAKGGIVKSYLKFSSSNVRVYRNGNFPSQNTNEGIDIIKSLPLQSKFSPMATQIASSGDLGYTYGFSLDANNDSSSYVRVWRKETEWKIAVDILEPFKK